MLISKYAPDEFDQDNQDEEFYHSDNDKESEKVLPLEICKIIDNEVWWKEIRQLEKLLLPFCGALNKLQAENACLYDVLHNFGYFYKIWQEYSDQDLGEKMISRLEKRWFIWEQPLLLISFLLHPEYRDNFFIKSDQSISFAQLSEWMIYYFCAWFGRMPTTLLGELQNYRKQDFPFNNISLKQFRNGILGFWDFVSAYAPDLSAFSTKIYAICINTASVERLFSTMGFYHTNKRNRLGVCILILNYYSFIFLNVINYIYYSQKKFLL